MNRQMILDRLREHYPRIEQRFGVASLAIFGSVGRDEGGERSDVDVLVSFHAPTTFDGYFDLKFYLEDLLGRPVDLVTDKALRHELRPYVKRDLIHVA